MLQGSKQPESWRAALKFISRCPVCSEVYPPETARLFAEREGASLIHLTCTGCQGYFMAMILNLGSGLSSVGMVTDLSFDDVGKIYRTEPLTLDEVLSAQEQIEANKLSFN